MNSLLPTYAAPPPPAPAPNQLRPSSQNSRPSSAMSTNPPQRMVPRLSDGSAVHLPGRTPSVSVKSSPAASDYANDLPALPFQGSDSVNTYPPQIRQSQHIPSNQTQAPILHQYPPPYPHNQPQVPHTTLPPNQNQQQSQPLHAQLQNQWYPSPPNCVPPGLPPQLLIQLPSIPLCLPPMPPQQPQPNLQPQNHQPQYPNQQALLQVQFQHQRQLEQQQQQHQQHQNHMQSGPGPQRSASSQHANQSQPQPQEQQHPRQPRQPQQFVVSPDSRPPTPNPTMFPDEPKAKVDDGVVWVPLVDPSTGYVSYHKLENFIQQQTNSITSRLNTLQGELHMKNLELSQSQIENKLLVSAGKMLQAQNLESAQHNEESGKRICNLEQALKVAKEDVAKQVNTSKELRKAVEAEKKRAKDAQDEVAKARVLANDATSKVKEAEVRWKEVHEANIQLMANNAELGSSEQKAKEELAKSKIELAKCQSQLQNSNDKLEKSAVDSDQIKKKLELENELLVDMVNELEDAALSSPPPSIPGPPITAPPPTPDELTELTDLRARVNQLEADLKGATIDHKAPAPSQPESVVVSDLRLKLAKRERKLEEIQVELERSQKDLKDARFPWDVATLGDQEAGTVKTGIEALNDTIARLQSDNAGLKLELDTLTNQAQQKRVVALHVYNSREQTKLHARLSGDSIDLRSISPTPAPLSPAIDASQVDEEGKMEVEVENKEGEDRDCDCGRKEVFLELASKAEVVFVEMLALVDVTINSALAKLEEMPLKERGSRNQTYRMLLRYGEVIRGMVMDAREVINR